MQIEYEEACTHIAPPARVRSGLARGGDVAHGPGDADLRAAEYADLRVEAHAQVPPRVLYLFLWLLRAS